MSKKATSISRTTNKALAAAAKESKLAGDASRLAEDAVKAAIFAQCASVRAGQAAQGRASDNLAALNRIARDARKASEAAVEYARAASLREDGRDYAGAVCAAQDSVRAAGRAGSLAAEAAVLVGAKRELSSDTPAPEPSIRATEERKTSARRKREDGLKAAIERSMRFLVIYDGSVIATFANEEDAFLLESELADLDISHGKNSARCEVLEYGSRKRLGGYLIAGGKMVVLLEDKDFEERFATGRH